MKKIGIVTFHEANNYGALLQAAALKQTINVMGYSCEIIDYKSAAIENRYRLYLDKTSPKNLIKSLFRLGFLFIRFKKTETFRNVYITAKKYNDDDYMLVFVGSDQVWSYNLLNGEKGFFLDFVSDDQKKASYAASFGVSDISDEWKDYYKEQLQHFQAISVREKSGAEIVKKLTNKSAKVVLDPTFLLSKEQWIDTFGLRKKNQNYILCYLFGMTERTFLFVKSLAEKNELKIRIITDDTELMNHGMIKHRTCSPIEWLELFYNARMIVTNSFHGIAFSIIFNKEFYVGDINNNSTRGRIDNILDICGLSSRMNLDYLGSINYLDVETRLEKHKTESLNFIRKTVCRSTDGGAYEGTLL